MKRIYTHMIIPCLLLAAASCSGDDTPAELKPEQPTDSEVAIGMTAEVGSPEAAGTRAAIESVNTLASAGGFGVFCYYTGTADFADMNSVKSTVMDNVNVTRTEGTSYDWTYPAPKRYWPSAKQKLSFFSYAPYMSVDETKGNMTLKKEGDGTPYVSYAFDETADKLSEQDDLLWGTDQYGNVQTNLTTETNTTGYVNTHFRHALTKLQPNISYGGDLTDKKVYVESLTIENLYLKGDLSLRNTEATTPAWSGRDGELKYEFSSSTLNSDIAYNSSTATGLTSVSKKLLADGTGNNGTFLIIPAEKSRGIKLTVVYHEVASGTDTRNTVSSTLSNTDLLGNRFYNLNLNLSSSEMSLTLEVQPWQEVISEYEDSPKGGQLVAVNANDTIKWTNNSTFSYDGLDTKTGYVYVNNRTVELSFTISSPKGAEWNASLIPADAFEFVDVASDGTITPADSNPSGTVGQAAVLHVRAKTTETSVDHVAVLRIYVTLNDGNATIVRNLVQGHDYFEYTLVQRRTTTN